MLIDFFVVFQGVILAVPKLQNNLFGLENF